MSKQTKGLKRETLDKFYTKKNVAQICIENLKKNIPISFKDDLIIEPSAGNGSFIDSIKSVCKNYLFLDIKPEHTDINKQDFFEFNLDTEKYKNVFVVGNPPFGRQSSLALKFIKKACDFCNTFAFILPKSFKKDSFKNKIPLNFHLQFETDLEDKSFEVNGIEYDVPCVFQIWTKKDEKRILEISEEPKNFKFVKKDENPDASFRRVGVYAGKIDKEISSKSEQSHYFIKFLNNKSVDDNIDILSNLKFEFNNTVGPKSISKGELIKKINHLI
jgi:predicted RNA methylase